MTLSSSPLSYVNAEMSIAKRLFLRGLEAAYGITDANQRYQSWRESFEEYGGWAMNRLLEACDIALNINAVQWPPIRDQSRPLVVIANHPFGVPDGIAILALAEQLGRPFSILINNDLLRIPEIAKYSLPIDFSETREAVRTNIESGREAIARLKRGEIIVIFPSGGVATARNPFGRAQDLPWKTFTAKLIHQAQADVIPLYFEGQNSFLFHAASRVSMFLRLSMIVPEAVRRIGKPVRLHIGALIPYRDLEPVADRQNLIDLLRQKVFALAPV
jgi:putative hemolysin